MSIRPNDGRTWLDLADVPEVPPGVRATEVVNPLHRDHGFKTLRIQSGETTTQLWRFTLDDVLLEYDQRDWSRADGEGNDSSVVAAYWSPEHAAAVAAQRMIPSVTINTDPDRTLQQMPGSSGNPIIGTSAGGLTLKRAGVTVPP